MSIRSAYTSGLLPVVHSLALLLAAGNAYAVEEALSPEEEHKEELKIEKPAAPLAGSLPAFYGNLEIRHRAQRELLQDHGPGRLKFGRRILDSDQVVNDKPAVLVRPTIGVQLFNKSLDTSFTYQFQNSIGDNRILKTDIFNNTQWTALSGKFNDKSPWSFGPSAFTSFMTGSVSGANFSYTDLGFYGEANYQALVPGGEGALKVYGNPVGEFYSQEYSKQNRQKASLVEADIGTRTKNELALADLTTDSDGNVTVQPTHPVVIAYYGLALSYMPSVLKNLTVQGGWDVVQIWKPQYTVRDMAGSLATELDHYSNKALTFNRLQLSYKVNDRVSIVNQTRHYVGGFYQYGINSSHPDEADQVGKVSWENRLSLMVTLF
ncbi:MAG: hypothetical protein RL011_1246 [Pseudomonadota bacterium]